MWIATIKPIDDTNKWPGKLPDFVKNWLFNILDTTKYEVVPTDNIKQIVTKIKPHIKRTFDKKQYKQSVKDYLNKFSKWSKINLYQMKDAVNIPIISDSTHLQIKMEGIKERQEAYIKIDQYPNTFNSQTIYKTVKEKNRIDLLNLKIYIFPNHNLNNPLQWYYGDLTTTENSRRMYLKQFRDALLSQNNLRKYIATKATYNQEVWNDMFPEPKTMKKIQNIYIFLEKILWDKYNNLVTNNDFFDKLAQNIQNKTPITQHRGITKLWLDKGQIKTINKIIDQHTLSSEEQCHNYIKKNNKIPIQFFYTDSGNISYWDTINAWSYASIWNIETDLITKNITYFFGDLISDKNVSYICTWIWSGYKEEQLFNELIKTELIKTELQNINYFDDMSNGQTVKKVQKTEVFKQLSETFLNKKIYINDTSLASLLDAIKRLDNKVNGVSTQITKNWAAFLNLEKNLIPILWSLTSWHIKKLYSKIHQKPKNILAQDSSRYNYKMTTIDKLPLEESDICIASVFGSSIGGFDTPEDGTEYLKKLFDIMKWKKENKIIFTWFLYQPNQESQSPQNYYKTSMGNPAVENLMARLWVDDVKTNTRMEKQSVQLSAQKKWPMIIKLDGCEDITIKDEIKIHQSTRYTEKDLKKIAEHCGAAITKFKTKENLFMVEMTKKNN